MRDADLLHALKNERDHQVFQSRCEQFVRRWSPQDPRDAFEFTGELMGLFRTMILTRDVVHQSVASHYFEKNMTTAAMVLPQIIIAKEPK